MYPVKYSNTYSSLNEFSKSSVMFPVVCVLTKVIKYSIILLLFFCYATDSINIQFNMRKNEFSLLIFLLLPSLYLGLIVYQVQFLQLPPQFFRTQNDEEKKGTHNL